MFLDTTNAVHGDLMATLNDRGIKPSPKHAKALHALLGSLAHNFHGRNSSKAVLCSLSPGQAKTTALQAFVRHVSQRPDQITDSGPRFDEVGILVCINTLDEIEAFAAQLDPSNLCVWVGHEGEQETRCAALGHVKNPRDAQVLVTTHKRIEMELRDNAGNLKNFWDVSSLSYSRGNRICRVWDEAFLAGVPVVLSLKDMRRYQPYLSEYDTEAGETVRHLIKCAGTLLDADNKVTDWTLPAFWERHGLDLDAIMKELSADRKISDAQLEVIKEVFEALRYLSGKKVTIRNDGNQVGTTLLTYEPTIPESFLPVVILDASGAPGIRRTYDQMIATGQLERLPSVTKSYANFKIDVWRKGGGKSTFIDNFEHRVAGIANWITTEVQPGERVLVIHHKPDTPEQVEAKERQRKRKRKFRPIMPDFEAALLAHLDHYYPTYDVSNLAFTTWGKHRAQNKWQEFPNVVAAGTLFKSDSVYEATYRIAKRYKPEHGAVHVDTLEDFKLGEYADDLLQGLGRIRIRKPNGTNSEQCPPARALVVAATGSKIPDHLDTWFTDATVRSVVLMPDDLDGEAGRVLAFLEEWRKRSFIGATITFRDVKAFLGISNDKFKDTVRDHQAFNDRLRQLGIVEYRKDPRKSKYAQGWQLTSNVEFTQQELFDERYSAAAIYEFN